MKRNSLRILGLLLVLLLVGNVLAKDDSRYPVMRPDTETWIRWQNEYLAAPRAKIDTRISRMLQRAEALEYATSVDLLGHIDYDPDDRDQGGCGNCWVWAGTGVMEIAHHVEDAVFDRLSIQYFDSCNAGWACCGGNLGAFATWYSGQGLCIPWDNANADFADGGLTCAAGGSGVTCSSIAATPDYPLTTISEVSIETHTGPATAIANIKNILNQDRAVYFGFALPDSGAWDDFFDFWNGVGGETEATLWGDTDTYCGDEWNEAAGEAGGHAVVILGYNDDDANVANHYWLALNSWGRPAGAGRPNGLFRIPTQMDYDCSYPDNGAPGFWAFQFQTLDVDFGNSLPIADANGPYTEACGGTTTTVALDGSGSSDLEDDTLDFLWTTDCPGGAFVDNTSATPQLTVDTSPGCSVSCNVTVAVTDDDGASDNDTTSVTISDVSAPAITAPAGVTVECDESTDPANTGIATATDACDPAPAVTYTDVETEGACPQEKTIARTWTATDACGNTSSAVQTIEVVDTTAPVIACNTPPFITPPQAPITFVATATDNCDADPVVVITGYECYKYTRKGKKIDKGESCIVEVIGDSITIHDVGGVGTFIAWDVSATDACGNEATKECEVEVVRYMPDGLW